MTISKEQSIYLDDFWQYDSRTNNFSQINYLSKERISGRGSHTITFDSQSNKILIFGGKSEKERFNDMFEYTLGNK